jgi:hypothetical protein
MHSISSGYLGAFPAEKATRKETSETLDVQNLSIGVYVRCQLDLSWVFSILGAMAELNAVALGAQNVDPADFWHLDLPIQEPWEFEM